MQRELTGPVIVPEEAMTLVLFRGGTVLREVPLRLRWREVTVVTP